MAGEKEVDDFAAQAYHKAIAYAADQTAIPAERLTRDDFLMAAVIAEKVGDLKMVQRLLLLADDEELKQGRN